MPSLDDRSAFKVAFAKAPCQPGAMHARCPERLASRLGALPSLDDRFVFEVAFAKAPCQPGAKHVRHEY